MKTVRIVQLTMMLATEVTEENYPGLTPKEAIGYELNVPWPELQAKLIDEISHRENATECGIITRVRLEE